MLASVEAKLQQVALANEMEKRRCGKRKLKRMECQMLKWSEGLCTTIELRFSLPSKLRDTGTQKRRFEAFAAVFRKEAARKKRRGG